MTVGRIPSVEGGIQPTLLTTKGDIIVATGNATLVRQGVGSNNQVLMADSAQADGIKWANEATATLTTTGDTLYASAANTPARLGIGTTGQVLSVSGGVPAWATPSAPSFVGCRAYATADQSMSNGATVTFTLDAENYDTDGFHSNTTNNSRITIPTGKSGYYHITAIATYQNGGTTGQRDLYIQKNGTTPLANVVDAKYANFLGMSISDIQYLSAGDYIEMLGYQDSGTTTATFAQGSRRMFLAVQYLGA